MFQDVDETLRELLEADVPLDRAEADISFERPTREWSGRLTRPTLNLFMFDVRERVDFRDDDWKVKQAENGRFERTRGPRRIDLSYMVTAWTKEPADEHRILGRVLPCMFRNARIPDAHLRGQLAAAMVPVHSRVLPADALIKPPDLWGVIDNEMRTSLVWVITAPLDVFAPQEGPLVQTSRVLVQSLTDESVDEMDPVDAQPMKARATAVSGPRPIGPAKELFVHVGGRVHASGDPTTPLVGAVVRVPGTGARAITAPDGSFVLRGLMDGLQVWRIEPMDAEAFEISVDVAAPIYRIEAPDPARKADKPRRKR